MIKEKANPCEICREIIKQRKEGSEDNGLGYITLDQRMFLDGHVKNCTECAKLYEDMKERKLTASQ